MGMKTGITITVLCISIITGVYSSRGEESILTFYNKAAARTQNPPDEAYLEVVCREKIDNLYITFVGIETGKVLLAAITVKKFKKPDRDILLKVHFAKSGDPRMPILILPTRDYVVDWGYVYDRNGDGKIDYVVYNVGPVPFKKKDFPADYPKREEALNMREFHIYLDSVSLLFTHRADDNYDGKVDAAVIEALDPERDWVEGWMVIRSTKFDGVPDEGWFFKDDINVKEKTAERVGNGFRARSVSTRHRDFDSIELYRMNSAMSKFNEAAEKCKLTSSSFYR